jgi:hypothetical protein
MSGWTAIASGWIAVVGGLAAYAASILLRARRATPKVAPGRRRWMGTSG